MTSYLCRVASTWPTLVSSTAVLLLLPACFGHVKRTSQTPEPEAPVVATQPVAPPAEPAAPAEPSAVPAEPSAAPTPGATTSPPANTGEPATSARSQGVEPEGPPSTAPTPQTHKPAANTPAAKPRPASPVKPTPGATVPAPAAKTPAPVAPLDLDQLRQELKDTKAIGVLSKLTLKNQMDDLLDSLRGYHQGEKK